MIVPFLGQGTIRSFRVEIHWVERYGWYGLREQGRGGKYGGIEKTEHSVLLSKHGNGHDGKANEDKPRVRFRRHLQSRAPRLGTNPKGLEYTGNPMGKMTAKQKHGNNIENGNGYKTALIFVDENNHKQFISYEELENL